MALVAADISIAANGDIRFTGTTNTGTVLELHRLLQDLADDPSMMTGSDDFQSIVFENPSERINDKEIKLLGNFNIDDVLANQLYGGSIEQENGDVLYAGFDIVGTLNGNTIQAVQNGALIAPDWWGGVGVNADPTMGIVSRMLIKVRDAGADIDGKRVHFQTRDYGYTYSDFDAIGAAGCTIVPLSSFVDPITSAVPLATALALSAQITNLNEGYNAIDVSGDGVGEFYYSNWDLTTASIADFYAYSQAIQSMGSGVSLYGIQGELFRGITHQIAYTGLANAFVQNEVVTFANGAEAIVLADDGTGNLWVQLLTGGTPGANGDSITGATATATIDTVESKPVSNVFAGNLSGATNLEGAYGLGIVESYLAVGDSLVDLQGNIVVAPPMPGQIDVNNLVVGEDYVLVGPELAGELNVAQMSLSVDLTTAAETAVVVDAVPTDAPPAGTIRLQSDSGRWVRIEYLSHNGVDTFTLAATDFSADTITTAQTGFVSYIDTLAAAVTESAQVDITANTNYVVRVRDGGATPIVPFENVFIAYPGVGGQVNTQRVDDI